MLMPAPRAPARLDNASLPPSPFRERYSITGTQFSYFFSLILCGCGLGIFCCAASLSSSLYVMFVWAQQDGDVNVGEALVAAGLAEVQRHGVTDERSSHYDALLAAETKAKEEKKVWLIVVFRN